MRSESCDVAVIGGGPAGAAAATVLAREGLQVTVLEKDRFPRFHVGESLLPYQADVLARLGVSETISGRAFAPKYGARFLTADGACESFVDFADFVPAEYSESIHVERSEFDAILLARAASCGARVLEEHTVTGAELETNGDGPRLRIRPQESDEELELRCRWVIDASGQRSFLARRLSTRRDDAKLRKVALFAHYENFAFEPTRHQAKTDLIFGDGVWYWLMPLRGGRASVGAVFDHARWREDGGNAREVFERLLSEAPALKARLAAAQRATEVQALADFSYRAERFGGPGYLLAGDAACFLDPIFSTGVLLALSTGELAGQIVGRALVAGHVPGRRELRLYERRIRGWTAPYFRLIRSFYEPEFRRVIFNPAPAVQKAVVELLAGKLDLGPITRARLRLFHWIVHVNRFVPLIRDDRPGLDTPHHA